jgi:hypothetical protein
VNPSQTRVPVPTPVVRGLLVLALPLLIGTCRLSDLIVGPKGALLCLGPLTPDTLRDSAPVGSGALRSNLLTIDNCGGGELKWDADIKSSSPWVVIQPESGTVGLGPPVQVIFNPTGLDTGMHNEVAVVNSPAVSAAQELPLSFRVFPCKDEGISIGDSKTYTLTSAECGAPHRRGSYAKFYSFSGNQNDSVTVEVTAAFDAYVALGSSKDSSVTPLATNDACLDSGNDPCIYYYLLPRPGTATYYVEVTSADSADSGTFTMRLVHPRLPNVPDSLDQRAIADSTTPVDTGGSVPQPSIVFRAVVSDPDLGDTLHLEVEARPVGTPFTGSVTATGQEVPNGSPAYVLQTGLIDNTNYHWRVRAVDQTGRAGTWVPFGGNPESDPDFRTDQPENPTLPTALAQFEGDSSISIPTGGTARSDTVVLVATNHDNDPGDQLKLQVEVKPVGTNFDGTVTDSSDAVADGDAAAVRLDPPVVQNNTNYHWRARTIDQTGRTSNWVSYGGNAESAIDFRIQIPNRPTLSLLNQYQSDGSTIIAQGDFANTPTVIFKDTVSDIDPGATIRLEVEVRASTDSFQNTATAQSTAVPSGSVASVSVTSPTIVPGGAYHWQARAVDNTNFPSGWTRYPGTEPDTGVDFQVAIAVSELVFNVQPAVDTAGRPVRPAVVVAARDANHNVITGFNGPITMAISTNPNGGTLSGGTVVNAVSGIATFDSLVIDKAGPGYRLQATTGTVNSPPSSAFTVVPGPAKVLVFTTQPTTTTAGATINPSGGVVVTARDSLGNTATGFTSNVTVAITAGSGKGGATLSGTKTVPAALGVAAFTTLSIDSAGTAYRLTTTATSLTSATSTPFDIQAGPATRLQFTVQPTDAASGEFILPPVQVTAFDTKGNIASGFGSNVTVAITLGTGKTGATLSGTKTVAASGGVATFSNLNIDSAAAGYTLTASATGPTSDTSNLFAITPSQISPSLSTLDVSQATITASNGSSFTTITVTAKDGSGNPVQGATVVLSANPGTGNTLTQPSGTTNAAGVATGTLSSTKAEVKTVSASINGVNINQTRIVTVNHAPMTQLVFTTGPASTTAGVAINAGTGVVVTGRDQFGNTATSFTGNMTMAIASGPAGGAFTPASTTTVPASAGVGTFTNLHIRKAGSYTIQASTASPILNVTSAAFSITTAPVTQLAFVVQPSNTADSAAIQPAVQVAGQDSVGNTVATFAGQVRMFIDNPGTNPGGGTLSGTTIVTAASGVANFGNLRINQLGTGYTLQATASGLTDAFSTPFDIIAGPASALFFTTQPTQTVAGQTINPAPVVTARDNQGNVAASFTGNVTVAIGTNGGTPPGTLSGTLTHAAVSGVANFPGLSINNAGAGYTLTANAAGPAGATSASFNIIAGGVSASQSTVTAVPSPITACAVSCSTGASTATLVTVTARDALGNPIQGQSTTIVVSGSGNSGATGAVITDAAGHATWTVSSTVAESKTVSATSGGVPINATPSFTVNPANPKVLAFTRQPNPSTAAMAIINPVNGIQVEVRDTFANRVTNAGTSVSLSILNNGGSPPGTLFGTTPRTPTSGIVTFNDMFIDKAGANYTLLASATGLVFDTSSAFTITVGGATQLAFGQQPTSTTGGATISPPVTVRILDAGGNLTSSTANVTVAIGTNPNNGALAGMKTVAASAGVAQFNNLSIDSAGTGYTLTAASTGLAGTTSNAFNITAGAATKLAFHVQPQSSTGGATMASIQVEVQDAGGNRVLTANNSITLAIGTNPGPNGVLAGTNPVSATNGIATFSGMNIDSAGTGYTLVASATGLAMATSNPFNIAVGAPAELGFLQGPSNTVAGATISPQVTVEVRDAGGNRVITAANTISMAIGNNAGPGGILSGNPPTAAVNGLATFSSLSIDKIGTGYTLVATTGGLSNATSAAFNITAGTATKLAFFVQPSNGTGGATLATIQVEVQDGGGNRVTSASNNITVAIGTNPNSGSLGGTKTVAASSGVAQFSTLSIDSAGTGYTLTASASGLAGAASNPFNITVGAAAKLGFRVAPSSSTGGVAFSPAIQVEVQDLGGNRVTTASNSITLAILSNPGPNAVLTGGTNPLAATNGLATFNGMSIDSAGTGYTLTASATGLSGVTSGAFNIAVGPASKLGFLQQPTTANGGVPFSPAVSVEIRDAGGNRVTTAPATTITIGFGNNPKSGHLLGTPSAQTTNGLVSFSGLAIDSAAANYTLTASGTYTGATSTSFTINVGPQTKVGFRVQPVNAVAGVAIPQMEVEIQDAGGNRVTSGPNRNITLTIANNAGGGTLSPGSLATRSTSAGLALFPGLSINKAGSGYTLLATPSGGLANATSTGFDITHAGADHLTFVVQPSNTLAGGTISPAVAVEVRDQFDNLVTDATNSITIAIVNNPGTPTPGTLAGTLVVNAVAGQAMFSDLSIDNIGVGYTLGVTSNVTGDTSVSFNIL